ncbi:MAG: penicillin acylase family protein [Taibaiella sp.]|nr:penicillin acylase family protein [Taibaiella sp.]
MRAFGAIISLIFLAALIFVLDHPLGILPPIGRFLDPVNGCLTAADSVNKDFSTTLKIPGLQNAAQVQYDERMVPHVSATNDHDLYYIQGYVHASFRLWQMDMQTRAAAGRVSEVVGNKALKFDRTQRRKGMGYAAENSLAAMEEEPRTRIMLDAYTAGVNAYISTLHYRDLPLEYKLIGFSPEPWTPIKCALLLKYMADDLTGYTEDIPLTYLRDMLPEAEFNLLFPERIQGTTPVIPSGTAFDPPSLVTPPVPSDSIWVHFKKSDFDDKRTENDGIGSNSWALSGSRTRSGAPILCNDPHLGLNLPSLWYEMQLHAPGINVCGVSLPGAPGIVIGFNDSISWGFTNNYRDVKDFYAIHPLSEDTYLMDGKPLRYSERIERIGVKGKPTVIDKVKYTVHGPVIYDAHFEGPSRLKMPLALTWMAHKGTNELLALYLLNRAVNYVGYVDAIINFQCPGQNMIYADKQGNISLWGQGQFVNKWKEQGRYIMNGATSSTLWGQLIPMRENPHALNPEQGYLSSANQCVTDSAFPYYYNGTFYELRAWRINQVLAGLHAASVEDMFALQNDTYSILAANTLPVMLRYITTNDNYTLELRNWNYRLDAESHAATIYQIWWSYLYSDIWHDDFGKVPENLWPLPERTMQLLNTDTTLRFYDDKNTATTEHLGDVIQHSYQQTVDSLKKLERTIGLQWYKVKNTTVSHLAKLPAFSYGELKIGGWGNTVNAAKSDHGPSWRMVVQMTKDIEAYGVYPGGQSGNPGSKYYASFLKNWVEGKYYRLLFLANGNEENNKQIKYTWSLQP